MRPKPMNEQALGLRKERKRKKEAQPSFCEKYFLGIPERDWTKIPQDAQKPGFLGKCKKRLAGIGKTQVSMRMDTRNEDRHVPSAAYGSEKGLMTQESTLHEKKLGTSGNIGRWTMKEGGWGSFSLTKRNLPIYR